MLRSSLTLLVFVLVPVPISLTSDVKPTLAKTPLTDEQMEIYRVFLKSYSNGSKSDHLNLANRTDPLDLAEEKGHGGCLNGIELEDERTAGNSYHQFDPKSALPSNVSLVDPEKQNAVIEKNDPQRSIMKGQRPVEDAVQVAFSAGMLTLSEIAFDKKHHYAVMSFSFACGMLCGHGETIVFQKVGEKWSRSKRECGSWIS